MALKYRYAKREEVPADQAALYVERDGALVLDVEGATDKAKVDEFRASNVALKQELEALKARFEGVDPEAVRQLAAEKERLEEEQRLKEGKFQEVLEARLKNARSEWDKERQALTVERDGLTARLTAIQIDQGVITAATQRGLRPTAIPDITARARLVFQLVQGVPRAFETDGSTVRYGRDGVTPMTLEEWVDTQVADAPHLFEASAGGGAAGTPAGGGANGNRPVRNPFRKESWNLTEQMKLQKSDPGLAARLKAAA